jgi:hypothetical protein
MDINEPQRYLGEVDVKALSQCILSQDASAWTEQLIRQQSYEVHQDTESIVMLFCDETWPEGKIHREAGWDRLAEVAMPLIDHIIDTYYTSGGTLLRAMAAKLKAGGRISPHVDSLESFHMGHRIHVPITTNAAVRFMIEGKPYRFEVGKVYELNNQKTHSVMNMSKEDRISFIFDYVSPDLNENA